MRTKSFRDLLASSGPDVVKLPTKSREQRLTESMPPVVVEMLERRRLMALTTSLDGGTLQIDGTGSGDIISVYIGVSPDTLIHISDGIGGSYPTYDPAQVSLVKILAGAGNDTVNINSNVSEVCLIYGEAGTDSVSAGTMSDTIYGGSDADLLRGYDGADLIWGDLGDDTIEGFAGNDTIYGGGGDETLKGGDDNDLIYGSVGTGDTGGAESIEGNGGNDTLWGEGGNDFFRGGDNEDTMYGGDGNDTFIANDDGAAGDYVDGGAGTSDSCTDRTAADTLANVEIS